jgi:hypothetical protein
MVNVRDHIATVTGNLSDPAIGTKTANGFKSSIEQQADSIRMIVEDQESFSEFRQTVEGFSFMGVGGKVQISGGDINLTGCIKFTDLNTDVTEKLDDAYNLADWASDDAIEARSIAKSIANGTYLSGTFIDGKTIKSPIIEGNKIKVYGTFQTVANTGVITGYMGAAKGMDASGSTTYGVALSNTWNSSSQTIGNSYVIVTNAGVRLQYGDSSVVVSTNGIYLNPASGKKAYYNGREIATV